MSREELELYIEGIYMAYRYNDDNQSIDNITVFILETNIFKAIRELKRLPFNISNKWYAFKTKYKLQKLALELQDYKV